MPEKREKRRNNRLVATAYIYIRKTGMGVRGKVFERRSGGRKRMPQKNLIICKKPLAIFVKPAIIPISSNHERDNGVTYLQKYVTPFPIRTKACRPWLQGCAPFAFG